MKTLSQTRCRNTVAAFLLATTLFASTSLAATGAAKANGAKADRKVDIGDLPPAFSPAKWIKGNPVPSFQKGHVYVVEFWATWCGPCKANIPRLTQLAKKYKDTAEVIGVDVWESPDPAIKTLPKVVAFVHSQGARMDYHVAADAPDSRIANAWLKAAGEGGIPTAFIIGKDGRIAWIGNPALGLETALPQIVAGQFDTAAARTRREQQNGPLNAVMAAMAAKDYPTALTLVNGIIAKNPNEERGYAFYRFMALAHVNLPEFETRARALLTQTGGEIGTYQMLCSIPASDKALSPAAYRFGRTLVSEALEKKDRAYMFYAMGAEMASSLRDKAGAVQSQTAAIEAAETDSHCPPEFLTFLRKNLEKFKAAANAPAGA